MKDKLAGGPLINRGFDYEPLARRTRVEQVPSVSGPGVERVGFDLSCRACKAVIAPRDPQIKCGRCEKAFCAKHLGRVKPHHEQALCAPCRRWLEKHDTPVVVKPVRRVKKKGL